MVQVLCPVAHQFIVKDRSSKYALPSQVCKSLFLLAAPSGYHGVHSHVIIGWRDLADALLVIQKEEVAIQEGLKGMCDHPPLRKELFRY